MNNSFNLCKQFIKLKSFETIRLSSTVNSTLNRKTMSSSYLERRDGLHSNFNQLIINRVFCSQSSVDNQNENLKSVTKCLINSFGLTIEEVKPIFDNYPELKNIKVNDLQNNISLLEFRQVFSPVLVTRRPWVLCSDKQSLIYGLRVLDQFELLKEIRNGKTYLFGVFLINKKKFKVFSKRIAKKNPKLLSDFDHRMDYFCKELEINYQMFCSIVGLNSLLLTKDMNAIKTVMQLLKSNGISSEYLIKDHWIFLHNILLMEKRIEECKLSGYPMTTWALRCSDIIWYRLLDGWKQNMKALGKETNKKQYLIKTFNCSENEFEILIHKNPRLMSTQPKKIKQIIQFLYGSGYTLSDIKKTPRIFNHSIERLKSRLCDQTVHKERPQLEIIFLAQKDYLEMIETTVPSDD